MAESDIPTQSSRKEDPASVERWRKQNRDREDYMIKLKTWLDDARLWHYTNLCTGFPYQSIGRNIDVPLMFPQQSLFQIHVWNEYLQNGLPHMFTNNLRNREIPTALFEPPPNFRRQQPSTYEFVVPPLWKRAVAELMDFLLLFLLKMAITFLLLENFDIVSTGFYEFENFQKNLENAEVAMPMAFELLTLEMLHRIIVCVYETYFLRGKFCATPGKRYMKLMVVTAESIAPGRLSETITATRPIRLTWQKSLMRAAMKNLFVGLFLPLCIAFYIFPYNRTCYDMMSNSVVVENHQEFIRFNSVV